MNEAGDITNITHLSEAEAKSPQKVFQDKFTKLTSLMNDPNKVALVNERIDALISEIEGPEDTGIVQENEVINDKNFGEASTQDVPSEMKDEESKNQAQVEEIVAADSVKNEEVKGESSEVDLQGNLEQETKEAVKVGQELADQIFDFFGIDQVTDGKKIEVDESGIKDFLSNRVQHGSHMENENDIIREIQSVRRFINESQGQSYEIASMNHLIRNLEYFVYEMKVDGKELNYWKPMGGDTGIPGSISEVGKKISKKMEDTKRLRLDDKNKNVVSGLVDKYEQFMSSMDRVRRIDNQTGKKIQSRDWREIYNL